jgi:hypothetical protein
VNCLTIGVLIFTQGKFIISGSQQTASPWRGGSSFVDLIAAVSREKSLIGKLETIPDAAVACACQAANRRQFVEVHAKSGVE